MLAGLQRDAVKLEDSLDKAVEWLQVRATPSLHDALLRRQSMPSGHEAHANETGISMPQRRCC